MSTHNLCFEQKCGKKLEFLSEIFQFLEVKFCIYLYRRVFVMLLLPCFKEILVFNALNSIGTDQMPHSDCAPH